MTASLASRSSAYFGAKRRFFRVPHVEQLEARRCLAFSYTGIVNGALLFEGTSGNDTLNGIYGKTGTIWYLSPGWGGWGGDNDTSVPIPTAAAPIRIVIKGYGGNDVVDFFAGPVATVNMAGFPRGFGPAPAGAGVESITFWGGDDNDTFTPPEGVPGTPPVPGPVILPGAGAEPNIIFLGGDGSDTLNNGDDPETFDGDLGPDTVTVAPGKGHGNDILNGGPGLDIMSGGPGDDSLDGGADSDALHGQDDDDVISGGGVGDLITGGSGNDIINGGDGNDHINGDDGNDDIQGNAHSDRIWGGLGNDVILTGTSDVSDLGFVEEAPGGPWFEVAFGNDGADIIDAFSATGSVFIDGGSDEDLIYGSNFADSISGNTESDLVYAGDGGDTVYGDDGEDELLGEGGADTIFGHGGMDYIAGGPGNDTLGGGPGDDEMWSNTNAADFDQPYLGAGGTAGWNDMRGTGQQDCDLEDGHPDLDPGCNCDSLQAVDDGYFCHIGQQISQGAPGIMSNDSGVGTIWVELVSDVSHGTLTLNSDGSFLYVPPPTWWGDDPFSYVVTDGECESEPATVLLQVVPWPPLALDVPAVGGGAEALTMQALMVMSDAAIARWREQGVDDEVFADRLGSLRFEIRDLPSTILGGALADGTVLIDLDAAGFGWFVDATPRTDREFDRIVSPSQREATSGEATGRADLLSVLAHEIGHVLGLDHEHAARSGDDTNLMNDTIGLGMRRNPTVWDAAIVDFLYWSNHRRK